MTGANDEKQRQAAARLADVLERVTAKAAQEFGLELGAIATGLLTAAIRAARASMPSPLAVASWLRDVADEVEKQPADRPDDVAGTA